MCASFQDRVLTVIYGAFVGGLGTALAMVVRTLQDTGSTVRGALLDAGLAVESSFGAVAGALMGVQWEFRSVFIDVGLSAGVASPIAVALLTVVSLGVLAGVIGGIVFIVRLILPP